MNLPDGVACGHRACLSHKTYPCPFCGRIAGRELTTSERVAKAVLDTFPGSGGRTEEEWFAACVELITPIVDGADAEQGIDVSGFSSSAAKRSVPITLKIEPRIEPRPWLCMPARKNYLKAAWECIKFPFRLVANFLTAMGQVK